MYINKESVAKRIRKIRLANDLSVTDFAKKFDVHKTAVSNWEHAKNLPSDEKINAISKVFDVSIDYIKYGTLKEYIEDVFKYYDVDPVQYEGEIEQLVNEIGVDNSIDREIKYITFRVQQLIQLVSEHNEINGEGAPYSIVSEPSFESVYLPLLDHLLLKDRNSDINDQIIRNLLDLLSRMNPSRKHQFLSIIRNLNWLCTNNIFILKQSHQTKKAKYGSINSHSYEQRENRLKDEESERIVDSEASYIMIEIITLMKSVYEQNKEDYRSNKYKTIF